MRKIVVARIPYARVRLGTCERIHRLGCSVVIDGDREEVVITLEPARRTVGGRMPPNRG